MRYLWTFTFVVTLGIVQGLFRFSPEAGQAVCAPLLFAFQFFYLRKSIPELWSRAPVVRPFRTGVAVAVISVCCASLAVWHIGTRQIWPVFAFAVLGAVPLGFAVRGQDGSKILKALPYFIVALAAGLVVIRWFATRSSVPTAFTLAKIVPMLAHFALMFPGMFVVEEVVFRGCIDPAVSGPKDGIVKQLSSALFVSVLWAVWHLPFDDWHSIHEFAADLGLQARATIPIGIALSFCGRRAETLILPCAAHALIDAYRNALFSP